MTAPAPPTPIDDAALARLAAELLARAQTVAPRRYLLGIAGIPGAGKSMLCARLRTALDRRAPGAAAVVPLDGFHLCNRRLDELGLRPLKGAPQTFDAAGYLTLLRQARDGAELVTFPIYDRAAHEPAWRDAPEQTLGPAVRLVITEGNYLLLDSPPWAAVADLLDECWLLETPPERARARLLARHVRGGRSAADAAAHYQRADLPNTRLVLERSRRPDRRLDGSDAVPEDGRPGQDGPAM